MVKTKRQLVTPLLLAMGREKIEHCRLRRKDLNNNRTWWDFEIYASNPSSSNPQLVLMAKGYSTSNREELFT
jgi:hypothetical protein